jgi:hypothetical protein
MLNASGDVHLGWRKQYGNVYVFKVLSESRVCELVRTIYKWLIASIEDNDGRTRARQGNILLDFITNSDPTWISDHSCHAVRDF